MFTKKPDKWKKYSVSIIVLAASFVQIWSSSDFSVVQVTSVEKRESREHFSASAYGLGFKKLSLDSLFSTSVTWTTLQSDEDKFVRRLGSTIIETKYYCCLILLRDDIYCSRFIALCISVKVYFNFKTFTFLFEVWKLIAECRCKTPPLFVLD